MSQGRRYQIVSVLGQGGFGTVYRARLLGEGGFSKPVALKVLNAEVAGSDELARRLRDEARVLGLVQHRAIVGVDALVSLSGRWTVVMEYVEGRDLRAIVKRAPIPPGPALEIGAEVAGALHAAWSAVGPDGTPLRLLHRDIKPANICVTPRGDVKVLDFGIARADFADRESNTRSMAFGTPEYMAPERLLYENGPAADVYALGATLFEVLVGQQLGRTSPGPERHELHVAGRLAALKQALGPGGDDVVDFVAELLRYEPDARPTARDAERRLLRLRHGRDDLFLREWAEAALPPLMAELEGRTDRETGTLLAEGPAPTTDPSVFRPFWGEQPEVAQGGSATYRFGGTPQPAPPTLAPAEIDVEEPSGPLPPSAPAETPSRRWTWALGAAAGSLAVLGLALALWPTEAPVEAPPEAQVVEAQGDEQPTDAAPVDVAPIEGAKGEAAEIGDQPVAADSTPATPDSATTAATPAPELQPEAKIEPTTSTPAKSTTPSAAADSPVGRWEGSWNGMPFDLTLSGPADSLRGVMTVHGLGNSLDTPVTGRFDAERRALTLVDTIQTDDAGSYKASLSADGRRLDGSFEARTSGQIVLWSAERSGR